jgi:hypothetical protein
MTGDTCVVYLDTNVYDHLHKLIEVTVEDVEVLKTRVREGRIRIKASVINVEEVLSAVAIVPDVAFAELRLIEELAGLSTVIKPHEFLIRETVAAYIEGSNTPSPLLDLPDEVQASLRRLTDESTDNREELAALALEVRGQVGGFRSRMRDVTDKVRAVARSIRRRNRPTFEKYWADNCVAFAEGVAAGAGRLGDFPGKGIDGLLQVRSVRFLVGAWLSLTYAYTYEDREAQYGDSRDILHAVSAAAACVFVTNDPKFARIMKRIPVEGLRVLSLPEFIASIK